jgi:hypothetical protein
MAAEYGRLEVITRHPSDITPPRKRIEVECHCPAASRGLLGAVQPGISLRGRDGNGRRQQKGR